MGPSQLSRGGAIVVGLFFVACGSPAILFLVGLLKASGDSEAPNWIGVCIGLLFVGAGVTVILDYAIGAGIGSDGDFRPGTPFWVRVSNYVLGLGIIGGLIAVFAWVAFGSGPRHFSSSIALPFLAYGHSGHDQTGGRIAFGAATIVLILMFLVRGLAGARRLRRMRLRNAQG